MKVFNRKIFCERGEWRKYFLRAERRGQRAERRGQRAERKTQNQLLTFNFQLFTYSSLPFSSSFTLACLLLRELESLPKRYEKETLNRCVSDSVF